MDSRTSKKPREFSRESRATISNVAAAVELPRGGYWRTNVKAKAEMPQARRWPDAESFNTIPNCIQKPFDCCFTATIIRGTVFARKIATVLQRGSKAAEPAPERIG